MFVSSSPDDQRREWEREEDVFLRDPKEWTSEERTFMVSVSTEIFLACRGLMGSVSFMIDVLCQSALKRWCVSKGMVHELERHVELELPRKFIHRLSLNEKRSMGLYQRHLNLVRMQQEQRKVHRRLSRMLLAREGRDVSDVSCFCFFCDSINHSSIDLFLF
jgi:hypothetical protein